MVGCFNFTASYIQCYSLQQCCSGVSDFLSSGLFVSFQHKIFPFVKPLKCRMWFGALKLFYPYICPGNEIMEQHPSAAQPTLSIPVRTWIPTTGSISRMQDEYQSQEFSTISSVRLQYEQLSQTHVYVYRQNLVSSDYGLDTPVVFPFRGTYFSSHHLVKIHRGTVPSSGCLPQGYSSQHLKLALNCSQPECTHR